MLKNLPSIHNLTRRYLLIASLVPILLLGTYFFTTIRSESLKDQVLESELLKVRLTERVMQFNHHQEQLLKLFTESQEVTNLLIKYQNLSQPQLLERLNRQIIQYDTAYGEGYSMAIGLSDGTMLSRFKSELPANYDPRVRPWYIAAIEAKGKILLTAPYPDAKAPDNLAVTFTQAIYNPQTSALLGVAGLDVSLEPLLSSVDFTQLQSGVQIVLEDYQGQLLVATSKNDFSFGYSRYSLNLPENRWRFNIYYPNSYIIDSNFRAAYPTVAALIVFFLMALYYAQRMDHRLVDPIDHYESALQHIASLNLENTDMDTITINPPQSGDTQELSRMRLAANTMITRILEQNRTSLEQQATLARQYMEIEALYEESAAMNDTLNDTLDQLNTSWHQTVRSLSNAIEANDEYTKGHCDRVSSYARLIAIELELSDYMINQLEITAMLHDVGKIGVPNHILNKPNSLNPEERLVVEMHPTIGYNIIKDIAYLAEVATFIRHHHEHFDGSGYPSQLIGETIPLLSRIICVADAYDAMTSARSYRKTPLTHQQALNQLIQNSGTQFDPQFVALFVKKIKGEQDGRAN